MELKYAVCLLLLLLLLLFLSSSSSSSLKVNIHERKVLHQRWTCFTYVLGWSDIGYSFLVGEDGNVYEGRGWDRVGAHTKGYNSRGLAISFIGSYTSHTPGTAALSAANHLISCCVSHGKLTSAYRLYGHRDAGSTSCPGDSLYSLIQGWSHYSHVHPI